MVQKNSHLDFNHEQAAQILSDAFAKDPWFQYLVQDNSLKRYRFFTCLLELGQLTGQKFLTAYDGELVGVAIIEPTRRTRPWAFSFLNLIRLSKCIFRLLSTLGFQHFKTLNQYMKITTGHRPKENHYYLVCVGVSPSHKGKGLGKKLILEAIEQASQDPSAVGIGLDTELTANIALYENFGFKHIATDPLNGIQIHSFFKNK